MSENAVPTAVSSVVFRKGRFICAWCGEDIGESDTPEDSHGICPDCLQFLKPEEASDE